MGLQEFYWRQEALDSRCSPAEALGDGELEGISLGATSVLAVEIPV